MAALVRHDAGAQAPQFDCANIEPHADAREITRLYDALDCVSERDNPRTAGLLAAGRSKMAQKLIEEAGEVALEAMRHRPRTVIRESADLVYHLVVLWRQCGIAPEDVWSEMRRRADMLGIAEKLPKAMAHDTPAVGRVSGRAR